MEEKNPNVSVASKYYVLGYYPWSDFPLRHGILQERVIKVFLEAKF